MDDLLCEFTGLGRERGCYHKSTLKPGTSLPVRKLRDQVALACLYRNRFDIQLKSTCLVAHPPRVGTTPPTWCPHLPWSKAHFNVVSSALMKREFAHQWVVFALYADSISGMFGTFWCFTPWQGNAMAMAMAIAVVLVETILQTQVAVFTTVVDLLLGC